MNKLDFTCTHEDRNIDRVLFDKIEESVSHSDHNTLFWTYYPTMSECNKVIEHCVNRLYELEVSKFDLEDKLEKQNLALSILARFVQIQRRLLAV